MKKIYLTTLIAVFLLLCSQGIQAQTAQTKLNQVELMKQFLGTYQANISKDTVETWETQQYGNALVMKVSKIIKGQKKPYYINNVGFDSKENAYKGYLLFANGGYGTWIGSFTAEKTFTGNLVQNLDPLKVQVKLQGVFGSKEFVWTEFNPAGVKIAEYTYKKVK
jgi:hypothetical protein